MGKIICIMNRRADKYDWGKTDSMFILAVPLLELSWISRNEPRWCVSWWAVSGPSWLLPPSACFPPRLQLLYKFSCLLYILLLFLWYSIWWWCKRVMWCLHLFLNSWFRNIVRCWVGIDWFVFSLSWNDIFSCIFYSFYLKIFCLRIYSYFGRRWLFSNSFSVVSLCTH